MPETRLQVIYSVTSTTYATNLFKVTGNFVKAELADGTELPSTIFSQENKAYRFDETGLTSVFYTLCGNTLVNEEFEGMTRIVAINVPSNVSAIPERCFRNCTLLSSVTLDSSVSTLGAGAFDGDESLVFIEIPSTALTIGDRVFAGCTSLSAINVYDATAPSPSQYTFLDVKTGGTLTYPAGADYSSWLSNNTYYLGYYNWNGVESGATPDTGDTGETVVATAITLDRPGFGYRGAKDKNGKRYTLVSLDIYYSPSSSTLDLETNIVNSNSGMLEYYKTEPGIGNHNEPYLGVVFYFDSAVTGNSIVTVTDRASGLAVRRKLYHHNRGTTPNIYLSPSAVTFSAQSAYNDGGNLSNALRIADIIADGCDYYSWHSGGADKDTGSWRDTDSANAPIVDFGKDFNYGVSFDSPGAFLERITENYWDTRTQSYFRLFNDTSGNTYVNDFDDFVLIQEGSGSSSVTSWINLTYTSTTVSADTGIKEVGIGVRTSGCSMYTGAQSDYSYTVSGATNMISGVSELTQSDPVGHPDNYNFTLYYKKNTSTSPREAYITFTFKDTSGNTYNDTFHLTQLAGKKITLNPNYFTFQSGSSSVTATVSAANTTIRSIGLFSSSVSVGSFDVYPTVTISGNDLLIDMPENPAGGAYRSITYFYYVIDADGDQQLVTLNLYQQPGETPVTSWVYINPSANTVSYAASYASLQTYYSGCSIPIDSSTSAISTTAFTYTVSGDSFITGITAVKQTSSDITRNRVQLRAYYTENTGTTQREAYINFTFYDTDGKAYHVPYRLVQRGAFNVWIVPNSYLAASSETVSNAAFSGYNETVESFTYTVNSYSTYPFIPVTVANEGDQLTFKFSPNPIGETRRVYVGFTVNTVSGNTYYPTYLLTQEPATGDPYITSSFGSEEVVGSGRTTLTGTVYPVLCEYDHITYMTGGSIPGMVVTTNGTQMFISVPANNTNQSRVGYVYITYYDTDGYTYQQTITIRQATGSGPGPGPDPDTGYVYTSFTISDNEQHRFFPEAQPGVTYYAAGQYYKTISACEARYSLYYVNSYGGVDVLPFKEKSWKKSDTITRFNYSRSFRNNTLEFENVNYMNEIKPSWELHTGWLSDEQSQRMHELVESTIVYLYDAIEKEYTPVVMTDKKLEYKTYHNQGKKFYNYTVNVEESQSKERR